jgi:hypothetical protein
MIYKIYPIQDATIYERYPKFNTGLDALLEVGKTIVSSSATESIYSSRALLKFDYSDLTPLVDIGVNTGSIQYSLKLYAVQEKELQSTYTIEVNTISGSWVMGLGRYDHIPKTENGVSWQYRDGVVAGTQWKTASFTNATSSYFMEPGGCNWYTASNMIITKSIGFNATTDPEINISSIVYAHLTGGFSNDGILIRRPSSEEYNAVDSSVLQYFSTDTNTIYLPHIIIKWNDWSFNTGSLSGINSNEENVIYFQNLSSIYTTTDRARIRLVGRPKYPVKTFATTSMYATQYYIPASSSYAVEDVYTKEIVIPYDDVYTRISCDPSGSFFNFWMNSLQPERWYKFTIKCKYDNNLIRVYNPEYMFKVERPNE